MDRRTSKLARLRRILVFAMQPADLGDQQLHALHLNLGSGKAIQHSAVPELRLQHLSKQNTHDLLVTDEHSVVFECLGLWTVQ